MSKPVKEMLRKDLSRRLEGVSSLAVVSLIGLDGPATTRVRAQLRDKGIRLTVVKNSIARSAFETVGIGNGKQLLDGPCALAYGGDSVVTVVRELVEMGKEDENLRVKAALFEGELFGEDRVEQLSRYPTREEAIGRIAAAAVAPARAIAGCLAGPAGKLAGAIKAVEERQESGPAEAA